MASIRNIKKSNKYLTVDYSDFSHEEYHALLHSGGKPEARTKNGQVLLDYLCDKYQIPRCKLWVFNSSYDPMLGNTKMAYYCKKEITMYNNKHYSVYGNPKVYHLVIEKCTTSQSLAKLHLIQQTSK